MGATSTASLERYFLTRFLPVHAVGKRAGTIEQYRVAVSHWRRTIGRVPLAEIQQSHVASYLGAILALGDSPATANKYRRHVLAILRAARRDRVVRRVPKVSPLKEPSRVPRAWMIDEVGEILEAARMEPGEVAGIPSCLWWPSLLSAVLDSGGRIGAVLAATPIDVDMDGGFIHLAAESQKTSVAQLLRLHPETIGEIRAIWNPYRRRVWPWPFTRPTLYRHFRRIVKRANVEVGSGQGSLFHRLRRTTASYLKAAGGDPTAQLGHSTPQVTKRYLDPRIVGGVQAADVIPRPPKHAA